MAGKDPVLKLNPNGGGSEPLRTLRIPQESGINADNKNGALQPLAPVCKSTVDVAAELQLAAGSVAIEGPNGIIEHVRISETDSPEAIEHCLRRLFGLAQNAPVVLREPSGCAVPLGASLLKPLKNGSAPYRAEVRKSSKNSVREQKAEDFHERDVRLRVHEDLPMVRHRPNLLDNLTRSCSPQMEEVIVLQQALYQFPDRLGPNMCEPSLPGLVGVITPTYGRAKDEGGMIQMPSPAPLNMLSTTGKWMHNDAVQDEFQFWCDLVGAAQRFDSTTATPITLSGDQTWVRTHEDMMSSKSRLDHFRHSEQLDTSPHHIDSLYDLWLQGEDGFLREDVLRERLMVDCNVALTDEKLSAALKRVRERFHNDGGCTDGKVPRIVFASLWQRLILGFVCRQVGQVDGCKPSSSDKTGIRLIEYTERDSISDKTVSENAFLFGGNERNREQSPKSGWQNRGPVSRWAWIETSRNDLLMKMGVKFFLHPVATEDLMHAAQKGTTKIDRYRHQYFVSLELYALDAGMSPEAPTPEDSREEFEKVGPRITRSTMSLLATGNPPTRAKPSTARDWLLSVVNDAEQQTRADRDPLDRFCSDQTAARKVLQSVLEDLRMHKRQREYQADFLLYSIIDRAAGELTPIYNAYGRRLRWLQDLVDTGKVSVPKMYVDEVSKVRLELQELRQWVGQIKGIIIHLECDCRSNPGVATGEVLWNFGADARGQGKSVLVFLRHTQDYLEQAADRLSVLDDLAKTFIASTERNKSDFVNQTLFVLTIATATFLPAQFLAGVYGMNFVDSDGRPTMPELTSEYGYPIFWTLVVSFFLTGIFLSCCCMGCKASCPRCPKGCPRGRASTKQVS